MKRLVIIAFVILPFILLSQINIFRLKAAYIEKFTHFITWNNLERTNSEYFVIGYYKNTEFTSVLEQSLLSTKLCGKKVKIVKIKSNEDVEKCHLIYVDDIGVKDYDELITSSKGKSILLISQNERFLDAGVHINFFINNNKLKFAINHKALKQSNLSVSYHLLKLSTIIK